MMFNAFPRTANALKAESAGCPFGFDNQERGVSGQNPTINGRVAPKGYLEAFAKLDLNAVKTDLKALFIDSQDFFPADYGHYGPLMIRLAWHAAGSYRVRDGRGGADGGRQRFDPERSWPDNTNLDKARTLLEPIKQKYGVGLSWGDLFVLAGDSAIESMGGPTIGFCGGRIDDSTGFWSERLGPNEVQAEHEPCPEPPCTLQGATELGLIYVNPGGPVINGVQQVRPEASAPDVRETFRRMGMNDTETVALVGGGHAFGKMHGACTNGAGPSPMEDPENPWPGLCGSGVGPDTATSGFEGPWTSNPVKWDNEYFRNLHDYTWEATTSSGGNPQWISITPGSKVAPDVTLTGNQELVMTTADLSFKFDPEGEYQKISEKFRTDQAYLDEQFAEAWYKLMTRDMGPRERCLGDLTPAARDFQNPLPAPPTKLADFDAVRNKIMEVVTKDMSQRRRLLKTGDMDMFDGKVNYGPEFVRLAWRCAATHRVSDYAGGCNGARIRLAPQKDWPINAGLDMALEVLKPVKEAFGEGLSWADLIVLAGNTALEKAGAPKLPFCGGRTDATMEGAGGVMEPRLNDDPSNSLDDLQESALLLGVSPREWTALMGRRSIGKHETERRGFMGMSDPTPTVLDNKYFIHLLANDWEQMTVPTTSMKQYKAKDMDEYILRSDLLLTLEPTYASAAMDFAADNDMFLDEFAAAWTKVMNADRFDGPTGNLCETYDAFVSKGDEPETSGCPMKDSDNETALIAVIVVFVVLFVISLVFNFVSWCRGSSADEAPAKASAPTVKMATFSGDQGQQNSPRGDQTRV